MQIPNATRQKEKKKNTVKQRGFSYPRSSQLHVRCTSINRCPSVTDDAEDNQNDAQSIKCDEENIHTMHKTSHAMHKHPHDAPSIKWYLWIKMTDVNHSQWKVNRYIIELERNLAPAKETETYKKTEHRFPKRTVSSNRVQALIIIITGPKSYRTANDALLH